MTRLEKIKNYREWTAYAIAIISIVVITILEINAISEIRAEKNTVTEYVFREVPVEEEPVTYGEYEKFETIHEWIGSTDFVVLDRDLPLELQEYTYYIADKYKIDFTLIMAVMEQESNYKLDAFSGDDYGLMQINKCNHEWLTRELGLTDITEPMQNIEAGAYVLWTLFEKYEGNVNMVLMAYNMGEGNARKWWNKDVYESYYSRSVLERQGVMINETATTD